MRRKMFVPEGHHYLVIIMLYICDLQVNGVHILPIEYNFITLRMAQFSTAH